MLGVTALVSPGPVPSYVAPTTPSPLRRARLLRSGALLGCGLLLLGCQRGGPASAGDSDLESAPGASERVREREATPVLTAALERREMTRVLETTAVLESELEIEVTPRSAGVIVELLAEEGDAVTSGQVLARLDDEQETLALREAEIAVDEAAQRSKTLAVAVDEARNAVDVAKTNLAQAERDLERDEALRAGTAKFGSVSEKAVEASRLARDQAVAEQQRTQLALERAKLEEEAQGTALARAELTRDQAALALERRAIVAPFDGLIASVACGSERRPGPGRPRSC